MYLNAASICHEMIHTYDQQFGNGEDVDRYCLATGEDPDKYSHRTSTFIIPMPRKGNHLQ